MTTAYQDDLTSFSVEDWFTVKSNGVFTENRVLDFVPRKASVFSAMRMTEPLYFATPNDFEDDLKSLRESLAASPCNVDFDEVRKELDL